MAADEHAAAGDADAEEGGGEDDTTGTVYIARRPFARMETNRFLFFRNVATYFSAKGRCTKVLVPRDTTATGAQIASV